jgi:chromosome partitioning protein
MAIPVAGRARSAQVIVVGNEKGGSGKSTVAMNIAVALLKAGRRVATIDLDARQKTLTNYIENRRAWAEQIGCDLEIPEHVCLGERVNFPATEEQAAGSKALTHTVNELAETHDFIVIDTAGHDNYLTRLAHTMADTLVTPLNDSYVDFEALGTVEPTNFAVTGASFYAQMVDEARSQRELLEQVRQDWIVLRNRLNATRTRNKRMVGQSLAELARRLNFRLVDGMGDRVVFREFYPRGLTAMDELNETTLGARPTMTHLTARIEVENLINAMQLGCEAPANNETSAENRDAA